MPTGSRKDFYQDAAAAARLEQSRFNFVKNAFPTGRTVRMVEWQLKEEAERVKVCREGCKKAEM